MSFTLEPKLQIPYAKIVQAALDSAGALQLAKLIPMLENEWLATYDEMCVHRANVMQFQDLGNTFLYDLASEYYPDNDDRLVAAHGLSRKPGSKRDKSRMQGFLGGLIDIQLRTRLYDLLQARDVAALRELFRAFFAGSPDRSIPHNWYSNNPIAQYEGFYASVFYSYFASQGFDLQVDDATNHGRVDMIVILPVSLIGVEFSRESRNVVGFEVAQLG